VVFQKAPPVLKAEYNSRLQQSGISLYKYVNYSKKGMKKKILPGQAGFLFAIWGGLSLDQANHIAGKAF